MFVVAATESGGGRGSTLQQGGGCRSSWYTTEDRGVLGTSLPPHRTSLSGRFQYAQAHLRGQGTGIRVTFTIVTLICQQPSTYCCHSQPTTHNLQQSRPSSAGCIFLPRCLRLLTFPNLLSLHPRLTVHPVSSSYS